jgi:ABC-type amino acid transport substrate-binding protein
MTTLINGFRSGLLLLCLIAFSLPGCVSGPQLPAKPEPPEASGTLLQPQLRIGTSPDYMPLAYKDAAFGLVGVEIDFAIQLGKGLGKSIVFVEMPFSELIQALLEERIDIVMSGMSITRERTERVSFTDSYARVGQMALVRGRDRSAFPDVQSFANLTSGVGFVRQTTGEMAAKAFFPSGDAGPSADYRHRDCGPAQAGNRRLHS